MNSEVKQIAKRIAELRDIFKKDTAFMARITDVSEQEYMRAESGEADFSFTFLQKIAKEFNVEIIELITGETPTLSNFEIVRSGEGVPLERRKGFKYMHLAALFKHKMAEPFMVTAKYEQAAQEKEIPVATHSGEEFNIVFKGKLKIRIGDHYDILSVGDSIYYNSGTPHGMIAVDSDCEFLSIVIDSEGKALEYRQPETEHSLIPTTAQQTDKQIYHQYADISLDENNRFKDITFKPTENFNFAYDVVDQLAAKKPDKLAMLWLSKDMEEKRFTFSDVERYSNKYANYFTELGIQKGDRVLLVLKRHYQFWFAILALHKIGAIAIPATNLLTKKDFEYRFNAANISAVICTRDGTVADECDLSLANSPTLKIKMMVNGEKQGWNNLDKDAMLFSEQFTRVQTSKDDLMLMYFTSGTTGYPKIACHTFTYALGHIVTAKYWHNVDESGIHFTISDTGWGKAVWGKLYGQWLCEAAIFTYDFDKFDAKTLLPLFQKYQITTFCAPPTMYRFFIKENLSNYDLSSLKHASIAGEALNPEVFEQFYRATGLKLMEGFGQTELTLVIANLIGTEPKPGSMGKPNPQYHMDIIDANGNSVKFGEVGEIVVRTDKDIPCGMFVGYYLDQEKTEQAWSDDIYHTGDMAWKDEDGYYWYVGRTDDLIKSSGYRIGPFEIESVLMEIPYILECAITGVPDDTRGQLVKATIVLTDDTAPSETLVKEIQEYVKNHTAPYKYPRVIEFVQSLPKTISGKIKRVDLRK